jgi:VanZ family protein
MASAPRTTLKFPHSYRPLLQRWPHFLHSWLPVFVCASIFAIESTAAFGANRTSAPLHAACQAIFGAAIDPRWSDIHHIIRKIGHFLGYGIFSLVCFRGIYLSIPQFAQVKFTAQARLWSSHALAIAAAFLVANVDEIHQTFLPNRTGCFSDVLLDTAGAVVLQAVLYLAMSLFVPRPKNPANCVPIRIQPRTRRRTKQRQPLAA